MSKAFIEEKGDVAVLRLCDGVINPIGPEMVADLDEALNRVQAEFGGLVLAGGEKFFSIGFNLPELISFDRKNMAGFFRSFNALAYRMFTLPMPTACAVCGHAIAGGTILALTADFRTAAAGKKLMGLNEAKLGVPAPYLADLMLRQIVADRAANEILYAGEFLSTAGAEKIGLVDETASMEEVEARAVEKIAALAALPQKAFSAIKGNRTEAIERRYEDRGRQKNERFLDCWFSAAARPLLENAAKTF